MYVPIPGLYVSFVSTLTGDSESHGRFRMTRQLNNGNQTLIDQQGWTVGLLLIQIAHIGWHTITLAHPE